MADHEEPESSEDKDIAVIEKEPSVSHASALKMFDGCISWLQQQEEAFDFSLRALEELRELAARKSRSAIKQRKISDFVPKNSS